MSFGQNLNFLRKMHKGMTQEELAEKLEVSRQTILKWEMDLAFPEMDKAIALCKLFSCSLDALIRDNLDSYCDAYQNIRIEEVKAFKYVRYTVISFDPETDSISHITNWAKTNKINPNIIGWDFPFLSQEQINVFHMHGYTAACIIDNDVSDMEVLFQNNQKYVAITIKNPFVEPFKTIPNAYKTLNRFMKTNGLKHKDSKDIISCYEKEYILDGVTYMDVYIAIEEN